MTSANGQNTNDEWHTPKYVIDIVKEVFETIDLDPASSEIANKVVGATKYFDKEKNGLLQEWSGKVFLNPPYSKKLLSKFLSKAVQGFKEDKIKEMIILTNSGTDTNWNQLIKTGTQAYTTNRIRFVYPSGLVAGAPSRGQVFTYFGNNQDKFIDIFSRDSFCWIPNVQLILNR